MKYFVRVFLFHVFAVWLTAQIVPGFSLSNTLFPVLEVGLVLSILMILVKPILTILFIPINFLTLGFLSWVINVLVIYILTLIEPNIHIIAWEFAGASSFGFVVPPFHVSYILSMILSTFVITWSVNLLHWASD